MNEQQAINYTRVYNSQATKCLHQTKIILTALTAGSPTSLSPSFRCIVVGVFRVDSL